MLRRLTLTFALMFLLVLVPAAAGAQTANYPGGDGEVQSDKQDRGDAEVRGVVAARPDDVLAQRGAPASLPVTGSDMVQLGLLGIALVGGGTVLVRRSRRQSPAAAA